MDIVKGQTVLLVTAMAISAVLILGSAARMVERAKSDAVAKEVSMAEREPVGFVLRECEGRLALYRENSVKPYQILDVQVYLLPEADREALKTGIVVETEAELRRLLEDFDA